MKNVLTRRNILAGIGSLAAAAPVKADQPPALAPEPAGRITPRTELVNVLEFESMAQRMLAPVAFTAIAGSDRSFFERITFRPCMMVPTSNMDMSLNLFGEKMFAPIMAGPVSKLQNYHSEGEVALARGASAAKAWMVVSSESSVPVERIAADAKTVLWYQVFADDASAMARAKIDQALKAGCKAICITADAPFRNAQAEAGPSKLGGAPSAALNWDALEQFRKSVGVPVVIKGIMTPQDAEAAIQHGIDGLIVSSYGGLLTPGLASSMEMLPAIADAVHGRVPILIDGSFRRGSDIFKALAYGATAVMVARPVVWGLAAYGSEGAQQVLEMLQTEVGRDMAHAGKLTLKDIDRAVVKLHDV